MRHDKDKETSLSAESHPEIPALVTTPRESRPFGLDSKEFRPFGLDSKGNPALSKADRIQKYLEQIA